MRRYIQYLLIAFLTVVFLQSCSDSPSGIGSAEPRLNITTGSQLAVMADDSVAVIDYEVVNMAEGSSLKVIVPEEASSWILGSSVHQFEVSGKVRLSLAANDDIDARNVVVSLVYQYDDKEISESINIIQLTRIFDYVFEAKETKCNYWGLDPALNGHDFYSYEIIFGDPDVTVLTPDGHYYSLDFMLDHKNDNYLLSPGVYTLAAKGEEASYSIGKVYSRYLHMDEEGEDYDINVTFIDGKITVEEADGIYTISGYMIDIDHKNHQLYYQGGLVGINRLIESTLDHDVEMELDKDGYQLQANFYGDVYEKGNHVWVVSLGQPGYPENSSILKIQFCTDMTVDAGTGLGSHVFAYDEYALCETNTFFKGLSNYDGGDAVKRYEGTWYYTSAGLVENTLYIQEPDAPIRGGEMSVERNADGTLKLDISFVDDAGNSISAYGETVPVEYMDWTAIPSAYGSDVVATGVKRASALDRINTME